MFSHTLRPASALLATVLLASCGSQPVAPAAQAAQAAPKAAHVASAANPTVVEIFQSQGCSSCPPANANVNAIADRPDVLALSFAVTYWDQLGWKDRFAKPSYTARQWDYAHGGGRGNVYTPQIIVNGRAAIVGSNRAELDRLVASSGRPEGGPQITTQGNRVTVDASSKAATVWLVRYDPGNRAVPIAAGENSGRTLPHRHIVTQLVKIGESANVSRSYTLPAPLENGLQSAILVQGANGGPILAAKRVTG